MQFSARWKHGGVGCREDAPVSQNTLGRRPLGRRQVAVRHSASLTALSCIVLCSQTSAFMEGHPKKTADESLNGSVIKWALSLTDCVDLRNKTRVTCQLEYQHICSCQQLRSSASPSPSRQGLAAALGTKPESLLLQRDRMTESSCFFGCSTS